MNFIVINDLLIEQEVLQLQLQLQDEMMNRLFTCKIKEHKDFILVMEGLVRLFGRTAASIPVAHGQLSCPKKQ